MIKEGLREGTTSKKTRSKNNSMPLMCRNKAAVRRRLPRYTGETRLDAYGGPNCTTDDGV